MIVVLSVPHTGTRFLCRFLDSIGTIYRQYHSEPHNIDDLKYETKSKAVVPVRDPLLCFTSTFYRGNPELFDRVLDNVVMNYRLQIEIESWFECEFLNIDVDNYLPEYEKIKTFVGSDNHINPELIDPVGNINTTPTDYKMFDLVSMDWSKRKKKTVIDRLSDARAHYGY